MQMSKSWSTLVAAIVAGGVISSAAIADGYEYEPSGDASLTPTAFSWSGFYIGGNVGYGFSESETSNIRVFNPAGVQIPTCGPLTYSLDPDGVLGGGQIGFNHQSGKFVFGIEADIQASDISDASLTIFRNRGNPNLIAPFAYNASVDIDWFGTVRGRAGYAWDRLLVYATGGFAYGEVSYGALYDFLPPSNSFGTASKSSTETGYVVGGGLEYGHASNWSFKLEYQYIDLGDQDVEGSLFFVNGTPSGETFRTKFDTDFHTVRVGLNYRFNRRAKAVVPLK